MKSKKILAIIVLAVMLAASSSLAQDETQQAPSAELNEIIGKLNEVLSSQKALMEQVASLKEELNIIKIRVTQSQ
jgi:glucosamine 6-phosphate synthetase-like amidotransferase/phosphosugar isomerase protein